MPALLQPAASAWLRNSLGLRKRGWIGVDLGAYQTKLAQVERAGSEYRLAARWLIPCRASDVLGPGEPQAGEAGFVPQLRQARQMFRGRAAAAALSSTMVTHRTLEVPAGEQEELRQIVNEEFSAESGLAAETHCLGHWKMPSAGQEQEALTQVSVLDVAREVSLGLASNFRRAGLGCRILDGLPCALARATMLAQPAAGPRSTAMLDIGHASVVFVAAVEGRPCYVRSLRGCGVESLLRALQTGMGLSPAEASRLLGCIGVTPVHAISQDDVRAQAVRQLLVTPLGKLLSEIKRTLLYLHDSHPQLLPERILLCGGGSCLPHLANRLTQETGLMTECWKMPTTTSLAANTHDSLFAVPAALSALAWEASSCT